MELSGSLDLLSIGLGQKESPICKSGGHRGNESQLKKKRAERPVRVERAPKQGQAGGDSGVAQLPPPCLRSCQPAAARPGPVQPAAPQTARVKCSGGLCAGSLMEWVLMQYTRYCGGYVNLLPHYLMQDIFIVTLLLLEGYSRTEQS